MTDGAQGYYGRPLIKPPEWTDLIAVYFWSGGLSGAAATLAFAERLAKNDRLARTMILGAAAGTMVSAFCLIADLKKPSRFVNMLRVFKPTSPMSVGVYIFSSFGASATLAAASELTGIARPLGRICEGVAALLGPMMSVYTSVLIGDTVVPAWQYARRSLPPLFAATSASTAAGFGLCFTPACSAGAARRLAVLAGAAVPLALARVHKELGPVQEEAYKRGEAGTFAHAARVLNVAGTLAALAAPKSAAIGKIAGALLLAGGLAERFAVFRAGSISAKDPHFIIEAQRERIAERSRHEVTAR